MNFSISTELKSENGDGIPVVINGLSNICSFVISFLL